MAGFPMNQMSPPPTASLLQRTSASIARVVEYNAPGMIPPRSNYGNAPMQPTGAKPFLMLPSQPTQDETEAVTEHLLQRPLTPHDQGQVQEYLESMQVTIGDYAPGGEVGPGMPYGPTQLR